MFTFGREHEKAHALRSIADPNGRAFLGQLVDAVHDVVDGIQAPGSIRPLLERALVEGGTGVWEQTGVWLRKLGAIHPELLATWEHLAAHPTSTVRFRVAAHLPDMPPELALVLGRQLLADRSSKVRTKAAGDLSLVSSPGIRAALESARAEEKNPGVRESIEWALQERSERMGRAQ